ncbi:MAG: sugar phosphate nucleotidyltransferase [Fimbriimonadales bacterium]
MIKAVVMAGGEGSRLRPVTTNRPKPLVPVCNKPIMEHILTLLKRHGITEVVATLHYLADEVQTHFGDGSDFDVDLTYSIEDTPLGTAGSVKNAEDRLKDGTFLIISGDALTDCDLTKAIAFHKAKKSVATLILARVSTPLEFGVVITAEDGRVERFLEKPGWSEVFSDTVNTGMYILEPEILDYMEPGKPYDWSGDIFPRLLEEGKRMYGYVMGEYWADVGSLTQYREAQEHLLSGEIDLPLSGETNSYEVWLGPNCSIDETAELVSPVFIGRNCKIKKGAKIGPFTVLGDNAIVEEDAQVERSVVWDSAYIGAGTKVASAIVCSRVTIKRDCSIQEDSVIGDRCLIDVGVTIRPRIKIWPDKIVERGSTVTMSLIWGNKWRGQIFRDLGVAGLSNIEITPDFATRLGSAYGSCLPRGSKVVTSRDSTRSSRMLKRALIAALLSVGCDVLDLRSAAIPVARHYIKRSGAAGAMSVRKLPGNSRVSLIEMFDSRGAYLPRNMERKVESLFFREDYNRTDPDDLGMIEISTRAVEEYQADFMRCLEMPSSPRRLRMVCDYGYSAVANIYPMMLAGMGVDAISVNSVNDAKLAPRTDPEIAKHIENLRHIVHTLGYDLGVLFTEEGERMTVVDDAGDLLAGNDLFAALCMLVAKTDKDASVAMSVTAPSRLEEELKKEGVTVIRTKADARSLMNSALEAGVTFAGDDRGGFIFPEIHPGFDAMFATGKLVAMLRETGTPLSEITRDLPQFQLAYEKVRCPYETKGSVMRHISEDSRKGERVELLDGIKIFGPDSWVLVLPDSVEPLFHVYAESPLETDSRALVAEYAKKIERLAALP